MSPTISMLPAMHPSQLLGRGCGVGGTDFSNGLAKAGYANRLASFADLFEDAEALGLELGDGDFFH